MTDIKKYSDFSNKKEPTVNDRMMVQTKVFQEGIKKLAEIMSIHFTNKREANWGTVGSFDHINEQIINIIESFDEEYAKHLKDKLKY